MAMKSSYGLLGIFGKRERRTEQEHEPFPN